MPRFASNLSMMFTEWPFLDRFAAAADAGFDAVEFLFPYDFPAAEVGRRLASAGLTQALFNLPPGDWNRGERGLAVDPARRAEFRESLRRADDYVAATAVGRVHLMAGIAPAGDATAAACYEDCLREASAHFARSGVDVLIEPLNGRDVPGYFLNSFHQADSLITRLALPNLKLQFDCYHRQILHGDVTMAFRSVLAKVGHVQIASIPSRHEPDLEELNYAFLFDEFDRLDYAGFVGCEYRPRSGTIEGLGWLKAHRQRDVRQG
jgi:hydroxypyruvate isomerase